MKGQYLIVKYIIFFAIGIILVMTVYFVFLDINSRLEENLVRNQLRKTGEVIIGTIVNVFEKGETTNSTILYYLTIPSKLSGNMYTIKTVSASTYTSYDSGIECLEDLENAVPSRLELVNGSWGPIGSTYCDGTKGYYGVKEGDISPRDVIKVQTQALPQEGDYILEFDEYRDLEDTDENFSVGCGGIVYNFFEDGRADSWEWQSVTCHFNEGINEFNFTSTGGGTGDGDSVWFASIRIYATLPTIGTEYNALILNSTQDPRLGIVLTLYNFNISRKNIIYSTDGLIKIKYDNTLKGIELS